MAQEQSRLQKLGRQKMPGWLALKVPPRLPKLAECNAPVGAIRSHVECHIVDNGAELDAAQRAVLEYRQAEDRRQAKLHRQLDCRDALKHRIHDHIQQQTAALQDSDTKQKQQEAKKDRLLKFNQHVVELRASLKQQNARKAIKDMEENRPQSANKVSSSADNVSRPPLVTRHAPNQQLPAQQPVEQPQPALQQTSQIWGMTSCESVSSRAPSAAPEVVKARVLDAKQTALEKKVKAKRIILPQLCGCPHDQSPLNSQYPHFCANNCPLYQNDALYNQLLQSLLFNYDL